MLQSEKTKYAEQLKKVRKYKTPLWLWLALVVFLLFVIVSLGNGLAKSEKSSADLKIELKDQTKTTEELNRELKQLREDYFKFKTDTKIKIAQRDQIKLASVLLKPIVSPPKAPQLPVGNHVDWMTAAGIAPSDFGYVDYIMSHESGWSPTKWNYAGSGAYGICQSLPGSKMASAGADWATNVVTQLRWCSSYALSRYGSWYNAWLFWQQHYWW